ncbi:hypothetical protein DFH06DRAFT_1467836, partial [Mycena polygramma]
MRRLRDCWAIHWSGAGAEATQSGRRKEDVVVKQRPSLLADYWPTGIFCSHAIDWSLTLSTDLGDVQLLRSSTSSGGKLCAELRMRTRHVQSGSSLRTGTMRQCNAPVYLHRLRAANLFCNPDLLHSPWPSRIIEKFLTKSLGTHTARLVKAGHLIPNFLGVGRASGINTGGPSAIVESLALASLPSLYGDLGLTGIKGAALARRAASKAPEAEQ